MPISRELQLARHKNLDRYVPLVHSVMWIHLLWKIQRIPFFIARR